jgi:hypothetical protein
MDGPCARLRIFDRRRHRRLRGDAMQAGNFTGFVLYQDVWNQWRWALYSPESIKLAESAVGYGTRLAAIEAACALPRVAQKALDDIREARRTSWPV